MANLPDFDSTDRTRPWGRRFPAGNRVGFGRDPIHPRPALHHLRLPEDRFVACWGRRAADLGFGEFVHPRLSHGTPTQVPRSSGRGSGGGGRRRSAPAASGPAQRLLQHLAGHPTQLRRPGWCEPGPDAPAAAQPRRHQPDGGDDHLEPLPRARRGPPHVGAGRGHAVEGTSATASASAVRRRTGGTSTRSVSSSGGSTDGRSTIGAGGGSSSRGRCKKGIGRRHEDRGSPAALPLWSAQAAAVISGQRRIGHELREQNLLFHAARESLTRAARCCQQGGVRHAETDRYTRSR